MKTLWFTILKLRARYWVRRMSKALGICPDCRGRLTYTPSGRPICWTCDKRGPA